MTVINDCKHRQASFPSLVSHRGKILNDGDLNRKIIP